MRGSTIFNCSMTEPGQPWVTISGNAPLTVDAVKFIVGETVKPSSERDLKKCAALVDACFASDDYKEGRKAFMEKRKPAFKGA